MHIYVRRFTNAQGAYQIDQIRDDGMIRKVDENHGGYLQWLAQGNVPEEVGYIEPPAPDPQQPSLAERVDAAEQAILAILGV